MKTKTKQVATPGPWKVGRIPLRLNVDENPIPLVYTHDGGLEIAQVRTSAPDDGEREANARLIAAAPELLEACKQMLKELNERSITCSKWDAVIAKAEGRL